MQIVTFRAANGIHGIPILTVEEFFRPVPVTPVPLSDPRVAGLMNLRGKSATVVHLNRCFSSAPGEPSEAPMMILLETADRLTPEAKSLGLRAFSDPVVLLVDRILDIQNITLTDIQPRPAHIQERFVSGVLRDGSDYISLLDLMILIDDIRHPKGAA
jgi:purine-binding chemotaxis protein CheW